MTKEVEPKLFTITGKEISKGIVELCKGIKGIKLEGTEVQIEGMLALEADKLSRLYSKGVHRTKDEDKAYEERKFNLLIALGALTYIREYDHEN